MKKRYIIGIIVVYVILVIGGITSLTYVNQHTPNNHTTYTSRGMQITRNSNHFLKHSTR